MKDYLETARRMRMSADYYKRHGARAAAKRLLAAAEAVEELLAMRRLDMAEVVRLRREAEASR
jgi:hypothetical protein